MPRLPRLDRRRGLQRQRFRLLRGMGMLGANVDPELLELLLAKDISRRGVGLYVPQLPGADVYVQWPTQPDLARLAALARVVRKRTCQGGWLEVGAVFEG